MSACSVCKFMKQRCAENCIFSPYFPSNNPERFASVHKVFGTNYLKKMLQDLPEDQRGYAVDNLVYEANLRVIDPINGCMGVISSLQAENLHLTTTNNNMRMMMPTVEVNPTLDLFPLEPEGLARLGRR